MKSKNSLLVVSTLVVILLYSFFCIKQTDFQAKPVIAKEDPQINVVARDDWVPMSLKLVAKDDWVPMSLKLAARDDWIPMSLKLAARDDWVPMSQTIGTTLAARDDWIPMSILQGNALT
jgi:hypothetical protein